MLKITGNQASLDIYNKLQSNKKDNKEGKPAWIIFKINANEDAIEPTTVKKAKDYGDEEKVDFTKRHGDFEKALTENDPCFGVMDYEGSVVFVSYIGNKAKAKTKMQYASIREGFKGQLTGIHVDIQANDESDIAEKEFKKK